MMKRYYIIIGLFLSCFVMQAHAAPEDDFGRLFSYPQERKSLDILRQNQKLKVITSQEVAQPDSAVIAAPAELPDPITLQGFVKRSDGASTVWVNSSPVQENTRVDSVQIGRLNPRAKNAHASESLNIRIPANGKQVKLKPGQVYDPESNQIIEMQLVEKVKQLSLEETGVIGSDKKSLQ